MTYLTETVLIAGARPSTDLEDNADDQLAEIIGVNLRRMRKQRGLSLDQLAATSGVSRAMLSQIELGRSMPSVRVVLKIARSLDIPLQNLMDQSEHVSVTILSAQHALSLVSADGALRSRLLFPWNTARRSEFYALTLAAFAQATMECYPVGTQENLFVMEGCLELCINDRHYQLAAGDAAQLDADLARIYQNPTEKTVQFFRIITHTELRRQPVDYANQL